MSTSIPLLQNDDKESLLGSRVCVAEGIDAKMVRDYIQDTYEALPQKAYACEMTRTNKGICYSPGEPADSAYKSAIAEL